MKYSQSFLSQNNYLFDNDDINIDREVALARPELIVKVGQHYGVQKN